MSSDMRSVPGLFIEKENVNKTKKSRPSKQNNYQFKIEAH